MVDPIIIKKYSNRSLYDTSLSKYISLSDLKQYVFKDVSFEVQEAKSKKDITRQVLLQIISDAENEGTPMFNSAILIRFIKMYGDSMQGSFTNYVEQMSNLIDQQTKQFLEQLSETQEVYPMTAWSDMVKRNLEIWQETQKNLLRASGEDKSSTSDK